MYFILQSAVLVSLVFIDTFSNSLIIHKEEKITAKFRLSQSLGYFCACLCKCFPDMYFCRCVTGSAASI